MSTGHDSRRTRMLHHMGAGDGLEGPAAPTPQGALERRGRLPARVPCACHIPGMVNQPHRDVRVAYWRARQLIDAGWGIHAVGQPMSRYGFIAEIPCGAGESALVIYPRNSAGNSGAAGALANDLRWLSADQRNHLGRLLEALHGPDGESHRSFGGRWGELCCGAE